eukprot:TRINITY_DN3221_c0_g1_i2.p1 TRINITY_DN3221_c0_g1~~TRINITY_DN3221_c0_g1_i2.p1  ORF type:complete len:415 (-),score=111.53 TRINITY_DN3221_c0_g1_i2:198-1442(-)
MCIRDSVEIVLGKLRMSNEKIIDALYTCNIETLTLNVLESLTNIMPTESEIQMVKSFDGDRTTLAFSDVFFQELGSVNGYQPRILALKFMHIHKEVIGYLTKGIQRLEDLFNGIKEDKRLRTFLRYTLAIGNYLNGEGVRGGAWGFKLDALDRMGDMKTSDSKRTLLMHVIEHLDRTEQIKMELKPEEIAEYDFASKNPVSQLSADLGELRKHARSVTTALSKQTDSKKDLVKEKLSNFEKETNKTVQSLETRVKDVEKLYESTCEYLCENPKDLTSDKFAEKILRFWTSCHAAKKEIERQKELQAKRELEIKRKVTREKTVIGTQSVSNHTIIEPPQAAQPSQAPKPQAQPPSLQPQAPAFLQVPSQGGSEAQSTTTTKPSLVSRGKINTRDSNIEALGAVLMQGAIKKMGKQ